MYVRVSTSSRSINRTPQARILGTAPLPVGSSAVRVVLTETRHAAVDVRLIAASTGTQPLRERDRQTDRQA